MDRFRSSVNPASLALVALAGGAGLLLASRKAVPRRRAAGRCRVVVVGAGFGGLNAALPLVRRRGIELTLLDAQSHHLFQPLLYQVATAALTPGDIAEPVASIIPEGPRVQVLQGTVTGVDTGARIVEWSGGRLPYDQLVIATGSKPSYFGHGEWAQSAPGLKTLDDALNLRRRILRAFERAAAATDAERERLLTFVLIGGGPTGVEMAGAIAELAHDTLPHDYGIPGSEAKIIVVDAGERVLAEFTPDLSQDAADALGALGVQIRTGTKVTGIEAGTVRLHDGTIEAGTVIWTAGTEATPVAKWLGLTPSHGGRVAVGADLTVARHPEVHVIGDAALAKDLHGHPYPGLAPVAKQQGAYVARAILRRLRGGPAPAAFSYRDYGTLATIGRGRAVAELGPVHLSGWPAWVVWAGAHIFFLIGFRNRVMVAGQWAFAYATRQRIRGAVLDGQAAPALPGRQPPVAKPG